MPEISVIVPVYKAEKYIHRCVDSILGQTFTDFEVILVDDGSPDDSGIICDEYARKDNRVKVIHQTNGGVSSARNAGLDAAVGNWIAFVDSDDYVLDTYLQDLYHPQYDLTVVGYHMNKMWLGTTEARIYTPFHCSELNGAALSKIIECNGKGWINSSWGKLFRSRLIGLKNLRFDPRCSMGEDLVFSASYLLCCRSISITDACPYVYLWRNSNSLTSTYNVNYCKGLFETEVTVAKMIKEHFGIQIPTLSAESFRRKLSDLLFLAANDESLSFCDKYGTFKFLFKNEHFFAIVKAADTYFPGTSNAFKTVLKLRSPFLMLVAFQIAQRKYKK